MQHDSDNDDDQAFLDSIPFVRDVIPSPRRDYDRPPAFPRHAQYPNNLTIQNLYLLYEISKAKMMSVPRVLARQIYENNRGRVGVTTSEHDIKVFALDETHRMVTCLVAHEGPDGQFRAQLAHDIAALRAKYREIERLMPEGAHKTEVLRAIVAHVENSQPLLAHIDSVAAAFVAHEPVPATGVFEPRVLQ